MGYPSQADERRVVTAAQLEDPVEQIQPVVDGSDVAAIQAACARVRVEEALVDYAQRVVGATRESPFLALGVSPRGFQGWYRAAKARALVAGRDYAVPDDFKETAIPALAHRLVLAGGAAGEPLGRAREEAERVMNELLERIAVPS
jgi:MoxR-like ATPase